MIKDADQITPELACAVCLQIEAGIAMARAHGLLCRCPDFVEIDGIDFDFCTDLRLWKERLKAYYG